MRDRTSIEHSGGWSAAVVINARPNRVSSWFAILVATMLSVTTVGAACNQPPIPNPGETVTWAAANSPFQICSDLTIPARGTVIVEPGVQLQFQGHTLIVSGNLKVQGQSANHVTITATSNFPPVIMLEGGTITIKFADVTGQFRPGPGKMTISDTTFTVPTDLFLASISFFQTCHR